MDKGKLNEKKTLLDYHGWHIVNALLVIITCPYLTWGGPIIHFLIIFDYTLQCILLKMLQYLLFVTSFSNAYPKDSRKIVSY